MQNLMRYLGAEHEKDEVENEKLKEINIQDL